MKSEWIVLLAIVMIQSSHVECADYEIPMFAADRDKQIGTYKIDPGIYKRLIECKYLPTRTTFLTDVELAHKFDLSLPQIADIKAALDKNDSVALEHVLASYLDIRMPPFKMPHPDFISQAEQLRLNAEPWLGTEITVKVNDIDRKYTLGEYTNWYDYRTEGGPDIFSWGPWGYALSTAYLATGDPKYVRGILTYARSFYKNARPPAQRPILYSGGMGPWSVGDVGRTHPGYMPWVYRSIAGSPDVTDKDKAMFLKMFYEHGDFLYLYAEQHVAHNFEVHLIKGLLNMALTFPEFLDSKVWRERCIERLTQNVQDIVLRDGGSHDRTTYHFAYLVRYAEFYQKLHDAGYPMPESFHRALEPMFDWAMWVLSPLLQYPNLNVGTPDSMLGSIQHAAELFPERADFAYVASGGTKGKPPERTDKVLPHTGFLTMRSDWSKDALFMAMNYNGSPTELSADAHDAHPDLLSFGIWAHGRAYMTNSGQPVSYAHPLHKTWCKQTHSSNTVLVDEKSQDYVINGGRVENWQSLPARSAGGMGFNYMVSVSEAYKRKLGVNHRRAVLFIKPRYWVVYDLLNPVSGGEKAHDYRWQGHFQPTELAVEPSTKIVSTSLEDGKRFYLVPMHPDLLEMEQGSGPIATPSGRGEGPYVHLIRKSTQPVSFTVLLYPTSNDANPPVFEPLLVKSGNKSVNDEEAVGCRVGLGGNEDIIAIAQSARLRSYGPLITDGESGYIRKENGRIVEAGLVGGSQLSCQGKMILKVGQDMASAYIRYTDNTVYVDVSGNGKISVTTGSTKEIILNGQPVSAKKSGKVFNIDVPSSGSLTLTTPVFSTDSQALWKALVNNIPPSGVKLKDFVLVRWETSLPSDAVVEYAPLGSDRWIRSVNPEPITDHRMVLNNLAPDVTYKVRIGCLSDDGRFGKAEVNYRLKVEK